MKYLVLLSDGMSDYPHPALGGSTPMAKAKKPVMDALAKKSTVGMAQTVPEGFPPGSDVANLSVMGYAPSDYYSGRSPLEAASIGIALTEKDVATRCNLVTLSDEPCYEDKTMLDYCADDISTAEAGELIDTLQQRLSEDDLSFHAGVSYRHCLVWRNCSVSNFTATPPHDITGRSIKEFLPHNARFLELMKRSMEILTSHPINLKRIANGKRPANSIWLWGSGFARELPSFEHRYGKTGAVISAVDLLKGIGKLAAMQVPEVEDATGYIDTNFEGKAEACLKAFADGIDFVYLHVEAPDECGHRGETEEKVHAIELIDQRVLMPILEGLSAYDDYKILILPDHATPLEKKTHVSDPVPFMLYHHMKPTEGVVSFTEETAKQTGLYLPVGTQLLDRLFE